MTKRLRAAEERGEILESNSVANLLVLLSCRVAKARIGRTFECKTCSRSFSSFQALGGHCTTHKRLRVGQRAQSTAALSKPTVHECTVCGMVFGMGQALGGHMRRHKPNSEASSTRKRKASEGKLLMLDLNSPPPEDDCLKIQDLLFGVGLLEEAPIADFLGSMYPSP